MTSLTTFSKFVAITTEPLVLLSLALVISLFLYANKKKSQAILLSLSSIATTIIIELLKNIFKVTRPTSSLIIESGYSFPSGHTTSAIVFFGLLTYIFTKKQHRAPAITISTLLVGIIIFTRLYLQVHWLTDIMGGIIVGGIILTTAILIDKNHFFK